VTSWLHLGPISGTSNPPKEAVKESGLERLHKWVRTPICCRLPQLKNPAGFDGSVGGRLA